MFAVQGDDVLLKTMSKGSLCTSQTVVCDNFKSAETRNRQDLSKQDSAPGTIGLEDPEENDETCGTKAYG